MSSNKGDTNYLILNIDDNFKHFRTDLYLIIIPSDKIGF
jgi:hypothetical protein